MAGLIFLAGAVALVWSARNALRSGRIAAGNLVFKTLIVSRANQRELYWLSLIGRCILALLWAAFGVSLLIGRS